MRNLIALILFMAFFASRAHAAESFDNCSGYIDSVPATLTTQGVWCLRADLSTTISSGNAITVANNNITIDCNHFKLGGLGAGVNTTAVGIGASDRLNATVRNCNVRGFRQGLRLEGAGHIVEDNRFESNRLIGIHVSGDGNIVRRNLVVDTGWGELAGMSIAINSPAGQSLIHDNVINGVINSPLTTSAIGISVTNSVYSIVQDNHITGLVGRTSEVALAGIYSTNSNDILFRGNNVAFPPTSPSYGSQCNGSSCACRDNVVMGPNLGVNNCTDLGGNSHVP